MMEQMMKCDICGDLISVEGNMGDPPKGHLCGICYRFICDSCTDWGASARGLGNICKVCTSKQVVLDLSKFRIPEDPVFLSRDGYTTNLDEAQQFSPEEFHFLKLTEDQISFPMKEAIIMRQTLDETISEDVEVNLRNLLSLGNMESSKGIQEIFADINVICVCGQVYKTKIYWKKGDIGCLEASGPCPDCGKKLIVDVYSRFEL